MARSLIAVLLGASLGCREPPGYGADKPANPPTGALAPGAATCAAADRHAPRLRGLSLDVRVSSQRRTGASEPILWTYTSCVGPFLLRAPCDCPDPMGASRTDRGPATIRPLIDELVDCIVLSLGSVVAEAGRETTARFEIGTAGVAGQLIDGPRDRSSRCTQACVERAARQMESLGIGPQAVEVVTVASGASGR